LWGWVKGGLFKAPLRDPNGAAEICPGPKKEVGRPGVLLS
jgi:hypothetical protein